MTLSFSFDRNSRRFSSILGKSFLACSFLAVTTFTLSDALALQGGGGTRTAPPGLGAGGGAATGGKVGPGTLEVPLGDVEVPMPSNLGEFVGDFDAAVRLGKAFFWDIQAGSDGQTACASCHFHAGSDNRIKGQLSPGRDGGYALMHSGSGGANYTTEALDYPFHQMANPSDAGSDVIQSVDDVMGTAGVMKRLFQNIVLGESEDDGDVQISSTFSVGGINVSQVTGRQAPTVINAVFNHRQFWDGRADFNFNGVSIWGDRDTGAQVLEMDSSGSLQWVQISIDHASLASQAVGPVISGTEMSWLGRDFKQLARKMLSLDPLADQMVDPEDMHLGSLSDSPHRGLISGTSYSDMIEAAFLDKWTAGAGSVDGYSHMENNFSLYWGLAILCYETQLVSDQTPWDLFEAGDASALTEQEKRGLARFNSGGAACFACHTGSEFAGGTWTNIVDPLEGAGAAVERMGMENGGQGAALVLSTVPAPTNPRMEGHDEVWHIDFDPRGMQIEIFRPDTGQIIAQGAIPGGGGCAVAEFEAHLNGGPGAPTSPIDPIEPHPPSEFEVEVLVMGDVTGSGFCGVKLFIEGGIVFGAGTPAGGYPVLINGMQVGALIMPEAMPDAVYDDGYYNIGVRPTQDDLGGGGVGPFGPKSITERLKAGDPTVQHLDLAEAVQSGERSAVNGTFRAPTLRNIALTGPYMHNGSMATLEQVVQFYARGSDFFNENIDDLDPEVAGVGSLRGKADAQADLVAFLRNGLTDPRVKNSSGPFSHPSLPLKVGVVGNEQAVADSGNGEGVVEIFELPATGINGGPEIDAFIDGLEAGITVTIGAIEGSLAGPANEIEEDGLLGCGLGGFPLDSVRVVRVSLAKAPQHTVMIPYSVTDSSALSFGTPPSSLIFMEDDWFHPQEIVLIGNQDGLIDGDQVASLTFGSAISGDSAYSGMVLEDLEFLVLDTSAEAGVIFIDGQATNAFANGSAQYPFHSIGEAADCASAQTPPGEAVTLTLVPGVHIGDASISGYRLHLNSSGAAVLQGSGSGPVLSFAGTLSAGSVVEGIEIRGGSGLAGGVLVTDSCSVTLQSCVLTDNQGNLAGGVAVRNSSDVTLMGCQIQNNSSMNGAGGIGVEGGTATVMASILAGNTSTQGGGGLRVYNSGNVTLNSCLVIGNSANSGGGIMMDGGNLLLEQTRVIGNTSLSDGGGVHCVNSAQLELVASKITNNSAAGNGGGICLNGGRLTATRATLASNLGAQVHLSNNTEVFLNTSILWGGGFNQGIVNAGRQSVLGQVAFSIVDFDGFDSSAGIPLQADPLFVDPFNGNHSVQGGSPAIDSGDPALGSDSDGSAPDMGSHAVLGN